MRSDAAIERKANEVLKKVGLKEEPVDVFEVASSLGARVLPEIVEDEISGGLYRKDSGPVIGVNAKHHPNRQRFTVAHEIGHLVLHESEDYFIDRVFRRDSTSSTASDLIEIEANKFAAALLMPKLLLKAALHEFQQPLGSEEVENLARRFGVSQQAMTFRLLNLRVALEES